MKKSKILGLSLSTVALTTVAVATPVLISSCSSDFVDYTMPKDFLTLKEGAEQQGYKLIRKEGTNEFDFFVPTPQWNKNDFKQLVDKEITQGDSPLFAFVSKEKLTELGFDKGALNNQFLTNVQSEIQIMRDFGYHNKNGEIVYPMYDFIQDENELVQPDNSKSFTFFDTFKIFQLNGKTLKAELKKQGLPVRFEDTPTPEQISKYKKAYHNSLDKNYTFNFRFTVHPNNK